MEFKVGPKMLAQLAVADEIDPELADILRSAIALMRQAVEHATCAEDVEAAMARLGLVAEPMDEEDMDE